MINVLIKSKNTGSFRVEQVNTMCEAETYLIKQGFMPTEVDGVWEHEMWFARIHTHSKQPCKGCPVRYPGCHDRCPEFAEFRAEKDEAIQKRYEHGAAESFYYQVGRNCAKRHEKNEKRKRGY